jgi:hypothetical protein
LRVRPEWESAVITYRVKVGCCEDGDEHDIQISESGGVEYAGDLGCWAISTDKFVITDISKERNVSIFRVKQSKKVKELRFYGKSATVYNSSRRNISEDLNLQTSEPLSCENDWDLLRQLGYYVFLWSILREFSDSISTDRTIIGYGAAYQKPRD